MGRALDERERRALQAGINSTREEISSTIGALRGLMHESLDWRAWVRRHPWPALAVAAVIGLRVGRARWL
jgi:ElaB/YqjD/DUF883 family membrane-anchored ribosome-binding protein